MLVTEDDEVVLNKKYANLVNKEYRKDATLIEPTGSESTPPLFSGYSSKLLTFLYPGAPVISIYEPVPNWEIYEPETYLFRDTYMLKPVSVRGTLGGRVGTWAITVYHVGALGVWQNENYIRELPNSPCKVRPINNAGLSLTTATITQPAHYVTNYPFLKNVSATFEIENDVAFLTSGLSVEERCLVFTPDGYDFMKCEITGLVSGSYGDYVIVAPLRETMPEIPLMFTGSTSGTQVIEPVKRTKLITYKLSFDSETYVLVIKKGWLFRGKSRPGDSGAPVFRPA